MGIKLNTNVDHLHIFFQDIWIVSFCPHVFFAFCTHTVLSPSSERGGVTLQDVQDEQVWNIFSKHNSIFMYRCAVTCIYAGSHFYFEIIQKAELQNLSGWSHYWYKEGSIFFASELKNLIYYWQSCWFKTLLNVLT